MKTELHDHTHLGNRFAVIPTCVRLDADPDLRGKGVTIALLDSGFYPHPDLRQPRNRILAYQDIVVPDADLSEDITPPDWAWHGSMTSVAAAGNGYLSDGVYRAVASEANIVLVKVSDRGKITEENIARGFEWVLANRDRYNIRVVSISLGGDQDVPCSGNKVDLLAEEAVKRGIVVVVAAGNSGCTDKHNTVPPANAPSVITVGGYDDKNQIDPDAPGLYCSNYGPTADGILKPEMIAPAIWVAAPILPKTPQYQKAQALSQLAAVPDYEIVKLIRTLWRDADLPERLTIEPAAEIRNAVEQMLVRDKIISTHYQHVDGTSFAAPIVASVVAQMLEANPDITPAAVKQILISTAMRIKNAPAIRQGYGMLNARAAVEQARREMHVLDHNQFCPPHIIGNHIVFQYHDDDASSVALAGDFNQWVPASLQKDENGIWKTAVDLPSAGSYRYKYVINANRWVEDPGNGLKESDGYGGLNSILHLL